MVAHPCLRSNAARRLEGLQIPHNRLLVSAWAKISNIYEPN